MTIRTFDTGSQRSAEADETRYDLISEVGLERLAKTYAVGASKYTDHNWRKGQPFSAVLNHALAHLNKFKQGDTQEDHLAHAAWGLFALMEFETTHPELNDLYAYQSAGAGAGEHGAAVRVATAHAASSHSYTTPHQEPDRNLGHSQRLSVGAMSSGWDSTG